MNMAKQVYIKYEKEMNWMNWYGKDFEVNGLCLEGGLVKEKGSDVKWF